MPNPARQQDTLLGFDGLGLADLVKSKQISNANLIDAANLRIDQLDPHLNAMTTVVPERAYSHAASTSIDSVFAGVPMVFKDLINVGGVPRTNGSRFTLNAVPNASVRYVRAAEQAGLTIIGMTNTPEFASIALTDNEAFGATRH